MSGAGDFRDWWEKRAEGGGRGALVAESEEGKGLIALGEAPASGVADEGMVEIVGCGQVEDGLEKPVDMG